MIYFLIGLLIMSGCSIKSFVRTGYASYCLIDYKFKSIDCSYPTMKACRDQYTNGKECVCVPSRDLTTYIKEK